jgi:hypothetical protein
LLLPFALIFFALSGGCAKDAAHDMTPERGLASRQTKRFRVLDAETRKPIPDALVIAVHDLDLMNDLTIRGRTDANGIVTLQLAREYLHLLSVSVEPVGYISRHSLGFDEPGTGRFADDPTDIYVYREPAPAAGLRIPAGFRGPIVYQHDSTPQREFRFPPDFPPGTRVWWTDLALDGVTVIAAAPKLGGGGNNLPPVIDTNGKRTPTPDPGADAAGVAAWHIGKTTPHGPWAEENWVLLIGTRDEALAKAKELYEKHGNGEGGYIYNGWLRIVTPQLKLSAGGAFAVTRKVQQR